MTGRTQRTMGRWPALDLEASRWDLEPPSVLSTQGYTSYRHP